MKTGEKIMKPLQKFVDFDEIDAEIEPEDEDLDENLNEELKNLIKRTEETVGTHSSEEIFVIFWTIFNVFFFIFAIKKVKVMIFAIKIAKQSFIIFCYKESKNFNFLL